MANRVKEIETNEAFVEQITNAKQNNSRVIVYFTAQWCAPCKVIAPIFDKLSTQFPNGTFLKVDFDKCKTVAQLLGISSIPTFHFYLGDKPIKQQTGANKTSLENNVRIFMEGTEEQLQNMATESAKDAGEKLVQEFTEGDLSVLLDNRCKCANTLPGHPFDNIFKEGDDCLKSDCDPELLLQLGFKNLVAIKSIKFIAPQDGSGPKEVKLLINQQNLGFDEARSNTATQQLVLKPENLDPDAKPMTLVLSKFIKVDTLTIFVTSNQEDQQHTTISRLIINGKKQ